MTSEIMIDGELFRPLTVGQLGLCGVPASADLSLSADAARWVPPARVHVRRERPGLWRCDVDGLDGAAFAPTQPLALKLGYSLTELPPRGTSALRA
jgi:hypothetical protein